MINLNISRKKKKSMIRLYKINNKKINDYRDIFDARKNKIMVVPAYQENSIKLHHNHVI